jgi:hypothetical protein
MRAAFAASSAFPDTVRAARSIATPLMKVRVSLTSVSGHRSGVLEKITHEVEPNRAGNHSTRFFGSDLFLLIEPHPDATYPRWSVSNKPGIHLIVRGSRLSRDWSTKLFNCLAIQNPPIKKFFHWRNYDLARRNFKILTM